MRRSLAVLFALASVLASVPLNGSAVQTVAWTSTADFDAGTKSDAGPSFFATNGVDQPTNWAVYPNAAYANGKTFVVWQGGNYVIFARSYDHATGIWSAQAMVVNPNPLAPDGHGSPGIVVGSTGKLHVFCCTHDTDITYRRSTNAYDVSSWQTMSVITGQDTYPHPVLVGTKLYVFFRSSALPVGAWAYRSSTDDGTTWGAETPLIALGVGAYNSDFELAGDRIYFAFYQHVPADSSRKNVYVAYLNTTNAKVFCRGNPNDFDAGTVLDLTEADANCRIENTNAYRTNFHPIIHAKTWTTPYLVYATGLASNTIRQWNFTRWSGTAWTAPAAISGAVTDDLNNLGDFIVNSATDIELYLTLSGKTGNGGSIERFTWDGATWSDRGHPHPVLRDHIGLSGDPDPGNTWQHSVIPTNWHDPFRVLFVERSYVNNNIYAKLYGWNPLTGFVMDAGITSGTADIQTYTDNLSVTNGTVQLGSARWDTFGMVDTDGQTFLWTGKDDGGVSGAVCQRSIAAGAYQITTPAAVSVRCPVSSTFSFSGDFDVRMKITTPILGSNRARSICVLNFGGECNVNGAHSAEMYGFLYDIGAAGAGVVSVWALINGVISQVGGSTSPAQETPIWFRITRVTNTFTFYYSLTGASWILDETKTDAAVPIILYFAFEYLQNGATLGSAYFDDFNLVIGTVNQGYKTNGAWTSPTFKDTDFTTQIVLTHSGLSATYIIDQVDILNADDGSIVQSFPADVTSGTTSTYNTGRFSGNLQVRVTLKGDGAGTPVLESVAVNSEPDSFGAIQGFNLSVGLLPIAVVASIMIVILAATKKLRHGEGEG